MNHLAHTLLAGPDPLHVAGGLLGDFWRGRPDPAWPQALSAGVILHRRIDSSADAHPLMQRARRRFDPPFRRYAGIMLDVWFDHLLACDFERLAGLPLREHVERVYEILRNDDPHWPAPFRLFAGRLVPRDGLAVYTERDHVGFVLEHIGERLQRENPMALALPALEAVAAPLARDFEALWPELVERAAEERAQLEAAPAIT
jgi:acyl carrier protein phosphodiesterase